MDEGNTLKLMSWTIGGLVVMIFILNGLTLAAP